MTPLEPPRDETTRDAVDAVRAHRLRDADPAELAIAESVVDEMFQTLRRQPREHQRAARRKDADVHLGTERGWPPSPSQSHS